MAIGVVPETVTTVIATAEAGATDNVSHAATSVPKTASVRLIALGRYSSREVDYGLLDVVLVVVERGHVVAAFESDALDGPAHLGGEHVAVLRRHDVILGARDDERRARDVAERRQRLRLRVDQREQRLQRRLRIGALGAV